MSLKLGLEMLAPQAPTAKYQQNMHAAVLGKQVDLSVSMSSDRQFFNKAMLLLYLDATSNVGKYVDQIMTNAAEEFASTGLKKQDLMKGLEYVSIKIFGKGELASLEVGYAIHGDEHIFSQEFVNGKPVAGVNVNG